MTLEQYLWRHHDDALLDFAFAVMTERFRPFVLLHWWQGIREEVMPITAMREGRVSVMPLIDMAAYAPPAIRAGWPRKVRIAADALRQAANEARERGAA